MLKSPLFYFVFFALLLIYILFTGFVTKKISRSTVIHKNQKTIHIILVWLVPFIWYYLVKDILFSFNNETMTKTKRKKLNFKKSNDFYESNKGL